MLTQPCPALAPSVTVTRFAITVCAAKLRLEALGLEVPNGYTVSRLEDEPFTSVTFSTTAVAVASTGVVPTPVTRSARIAPGPSGPPERVSRRRKGVTGT